LGEYSFIFAINDNFQGKFQPMSEIKRNQIQIGDQVRIVLKKDQRTQKLIDGVVKEILTRSASHPHGIKVRLGGGQVGRVKELLKTPPF
jgi:uncharacterized repeat protein (TIGR03833 family)